MTSPALSYTAPSMAEGPYFTASITVRPTHTNFVGHGSDDYGGHGTASGIGCHVSRVCDILGHEMLDYRTTSIMHTRRQSVGNVAVTTMEAADSITVAAVEVNTTMAVAAMTTPETMLQWYFYTGATGHLSNDVECLSEQWWSQDFLIGQAKLLSVLATQDPA